MSDPRIEIKEGHSKGRALEVFILVSIFVSLWIMISVVVSLIATAFLARANSVDYFELFPWTLAGVAALCGIGIVIFLAYCVRIRRRQRP